MCNDPAGPTGLKFPGMLDEPIGSLWRPSSVQTCPGSRKGICGDTAFMIVTYSLFVISPASCMSGHMSMRKLVVGKVNNSLRQLVISV
jgi:hypothetical protein